METKTDFETIRLGGLYGAKKFITPSIPEFQTQLEKEKELAENVDFQPCLVTWNGGRFDIPLLRRNGINLDGWVFIDAMQLAQMYDHGFKRKSLDAWCDYFHIPGKSHPEIDYDEAPDHELAEYLSNDLSITYRVFTHLLENKKGTLNNHITKPLMVEHKAAELVTEQVRTGVSFNVSKAIGLHNYCDEIMASIEMLVEPDLPERPLPLSKLDCAPKIQFKKDGSLSANMVKWLGRNDLWYNPSTKTISDSKHTRTEIVPFEGPWKTTAPLKLSNMAGIKEWLLESGWEPTEWNMKDGRKTGPRLTLKASGEPCPNLDKVGFLHMDSYKRWLTVRSRRNVLESDKGTGWIPTAVANFGYLGADGDSMGANTSRWTHKCVANVPRVTSYLGKEMRGLFEARPGKGLVGWDASALEARIEAHFCKPHDPDYASELCDGDVHKRNLMLMPSLGTRDNAKTFKYAITYGAQVPRLAKQFGWSNAKAEEVFNSFWEKNTALRQVRDETIAEWEANGKKFILGLDGRPIHTRSKHSLLNARFQSAGAIVMKYAMLIADTQIGKLAEKHKFYAKGLIRYHDEEQWETDPVWTNAVGTLGCTSIKKAGELLGIRVPLEAEYKVGETWADTH